MPSSPNGDADLLGLSNPLDVNNSSSANNTTAASRPTHPNRRPSTLDRRNSSSSEYDRKSSSNSRNCPQQLATPPSAQQILSTSTSSQHHHQQPASSSDEQRMSESKSKSKLPSRMIRRSKDKRGRSREKLYKGKGTAKTGIDDSASSDAALGVDTNTTTKSPPPPDKTSTPSSSAPPSRSQHKIDAFSSPWAKAQMKHLAQRSDRTKERSKSRSRKSRMEGASLRKSISRLKEHSKSRGRKERNTVGGTATTNTTIPLKGGESSAKTKYHSARRRLPMSSNQMNDYLEEFNDDSKKREFKSRPHETKNERMSPTPHIPDLTVPNTIPIVRRLSLSAGGLLNCNDDMIKTLTKEIEAEDKEKATRPVARKRSNSWDSTHQQAESNTAINTKPPAESRKDYPQLIRRSSDSGPSLTIDVGKVELGQQRRKTSKYRRTSLDNSCIVSKGRCEKKRPSSLDPERRANQAATDIMRSSRSSVGSFDINMLRDDSDAEDDKIKGVVVLIWMMSGRNVPRRETRPSNAV
eukprot:g14496.t1 g14496   contig9:1959729-1961297(-)